MNRIQAFVSRMFRIPQTGRRVPSQFGTNSRQYASAKSTRLTSGWTVSNTSADAELVTSLRELRSRSRALGRDSPYAKRGRTITVNNIIGCGIRLQAQVKTTRDEFNKRINDDIEEQWCQWCCAEYCHKGARLSFPDMERLLIGEVFDAGEVFIRRHFTAMPGSRVPYALEVIEAERIADTVDHGTIAIPTDNQVRMGVEVDRYYRPVAYYIRRYHPNEERWMGTQRDQIERVPAEEIIHLARITRWPQTRGEPWLHAVATTLNDMDGYSEAEITRARSQACINGAIETPEDAASFGEEQADGSVEMEVAPGSYKRLNPGEKLSTGPMNSPNPQYADFMREKKREVAVGTGVNYASLSGDYSQADYSPLKLSLNDDRDSWKDIQQWFIRTFRVPVHKEWLQQAVYAGAVSSIPAQSYAVSPGNYEVAQFRTRGWVYVDPTKEVAADKDAVRAGFKTLQDVLVNQGSDIEDLIDQRAHELEMLDEAGLVLDTNPEQTAGTGAAQPDPKAALPVMPQPPAPQAPQRIEGARIELAPTFNLSMPEVRNEVLPSNVNVHVQSPDISLRPGSITVEAPEISIRQPDIHITTPEVRVAQPAITVLNTVETPVVNVEAPQVTVQPPVIHVEAPQVSVRNDVAVPSVSVEAPVVHVQPAIVNVEAPEVSVRNEVAVPSVQVAAPVVHVQPPMVTVGAPEVTVRNEVAVPSVTVEAAQVTVPAPVVNLNAPEYETVETRAVRDKTGRIEKTVTTRKKR
jgi:lambda family phage portal protein